MKREFFEENRKELYKSLEPQSLVIMLAGHAPRKTNDEDYPFFTNRNFLYLTGVEQAGTILMAVIGNNGEYEEKMYILPPDAMKERWTGRRIKEAEAEEKSGVHTFGYVDSFKEEMERYIHSGNIKRVCLDFDEAFQKDGGNEAFVLAGELRKTAPYMTLENIHPQLKRQRTIKKPCEIEAMRKAEIITGAGIEAMMRASKPGMYEYQYKAEFDYALAQRGVLAPGFPSIISAGDNNFCIHYYDYRGQSKDGDMILNDVGAVWDYEINDVSRGWPCNGKFSERQKLLYQCAYNTSEYMFKTLKPGIPMAEVDKMVRQYNYEQLRQAGVCKNYDDIGTYMWHGGAHHVGFDVHDVVDAKDRLTAPNMVFCIDVGIYHEEWGIGFRLEDNCLITEDGCENLSHAIPRTIEQIEGIMGH
ncbi:MAG: aminopeptidase P N-terminal domain-containing protein [Bariatricus sp.]|nr:aminopeptidase P N-terminal domain-containing protein [Bariatricus sp.]